MRQDIPSDTPVLEQRAGDSRLLSRLYRDAGLAAVAAELDLELDALEPDMAKAVQRGARVLLEPHGILAA
jgi:hypothetical protein